jgi:hypothetical protein
MPIRFRCAYCKQLMAIARRKAGAIVRCPRCAGEVIVPAGQEAAAGSATGRLNALLEADDFDKGLADVEPIAEEPPNPPPPLFHANPLMKTESHPEPDIISPPLQRSLRRSGLFFPTPMLIAAAVLVLGMVGLAFLVGFIAGRWTVP